MGGGGGFGGFGPVHRGAAVAAEATMWQDRSNPADGGISV